MKKILPYCVFVFAVLALCGICFGQDTEETTAVEPEDAESTEGESADAKIIAQIEGEEVSIDDFNVAYYKARKVDANNQFVGEDGRLKFFNWYVDYRVVLKKAIKDNAEKESSYKIRYERAKKTLIVAEYTKDSLSQGAKITSSQIKAYYKVHKDEFKTKDGKIKKLSTVEEQIRKILESEIITENRKKFLELFQKIKSGADIVKFRDNMFLQKEDAKKPVAVVNGDTIYYGEFENVIEELKNMPGAQAVDEMRDGILDRLIEDYLVYQEALKKGYGKNKNVTEQYEDLKNTLLITTCIEKNVMDKIEVSDKEIKAYYDENKDKKDFDVKERVHIAEIAVMTEEEAGAIKSQIDKGADFAKLAKEKSMGITASKGGDLGFVPRGVFEPEFEREIFSLKPGEVSNPVKMPRSAGWVIVKVFEKKSAGKYQYDEVKDTLKKVLLSQKQKTYYDEWLKELKNTMKIKSFPENID